MGDVIHALPVVTDLLRRHPAAQVTWVVEESFADLPALHPGVGQVVTVALRRWRKTPFARDTRAQVRQVREQLSATPFDLVLDLQGLIKSAWVMGWTRGPRAGFSFGCAREPLAALRYQRRYRVDMAAHAIERGRQLAAQALDYVIDGLPVFGLSPVGERLPMLPQGGYAVLLHATSRADKQWPVANWHALARTLMDDGLQVVLPWGNHDEQRAAQAIAAAVPGAQVMPRLSLAQCALLLRDAAAVVGVDTGLTHLSAALDRPTVALFAATPAWRFGPYWTRRAASLGSQGAWPTPAEVRERLVPLMSVSPA